MLVRIRKAYPIGYSIQVTNGNPMREQVIQSVSAVDFQDAIGLGLGAAKDVQAQLWLDPDCVVKLAEQMFPVEV